METEEAEEEEAKRRKMDDVTDTQFLNSLLGLCAEL